MAMLSSVMRKILVRPVRALLPSFILSCLICYLLLYFGLIQVKILHVKKLGGVEGEGGESLADISRDSLGELDKEQSLAQVAVDSREGNSTELKSNNQPNGFFVSMFGISNKEEKKESSKKKKKKKMTKLNLTKDIVLKSQKEINSDFSVRYDLNKLSEANNCSDWNVTRMPSYVRLCKQKHIDKEVLLTLFTTMHDSKKSHYIYENTIKLWSDLGTQIRRILFVSSPVVEKELVKDACANNWDVMTAPLCDKNNLPVLKSMFLAAKQVQESKFYGYANGDILYDESLLRTLELIDKMKPHFPTNLLVGRRTNVQLQGDQAIKDFTELRHLVDKHGNDGWVAAVDYFIVRGEYPWEEIPKLVIGRTAYDNWMIRYAVGKKIGVVDCTHSLLSAHQVGQTGYYSSHRKKDPHINIRITGGFDFTRGLISCAQLKTRSDNGQVKLMRRTKYGMCGPGHWGKRKIDRYGPEEEAVFDPNEWNIYLKTTSKPRSRSKPKPK